MDAKGSRMSNDDDDRQHNVEESLGEEELARLADGTLPESAREALRARVARSPELQARLRDQERAVGLVRAAGEIAAPASLRESVQELADGTTGGRSRRVRAAERRRIAVWRPRASLALVALAAVLVAVVTISLHGGTRRPSTEPPIWRSPRRPDRRPRSTPPTTTGWRSAAAGGAGSRSPPTCASADGRRPACATTRSTAGG